MSTKKFASEMRDVIEGIKAQGIHEVSCDNLIAYLQMVEGSRGDDPSSLEVERYKAELQNWVEANRRNHEGQMEMFRSVITAGQSAIKSSFLLNGGAAIALLAFIGNLTQHRPDKVAAFASCLVPFALGVLAIAVTSGVTYLSQWLYHRSSPMPRKVGLGLNILAMVLGFASYGLFSWGLYDVYLSFRTYV